ncbi:alpha/beta hydrolase [uncultured Cohaesibacter sp.]|uniref:alpha/beta hydrolase n=1 Tax=uncultured Cohaesibacter sp. TaxID=1002546 RepID=UPI002931E598|nr:alpha/beta hydrolase [uncultured Cohaesibacter sp.]
MVHSKSDFRTGKHSLKRLAVAMTCLTIGLGEAAAQHSPTGDVISQSTVSDAPPITVPLTGESTIGELLAHPALRAFTTHILPWANRNYQEDMPLTQIARLLPYHSAVNLETVLSGVNRLIELHQQGVTVFHEIYSEVERARRSDLDEAGLFFFPGKPGAPFAVIAPGGGFSYVGSVHEGFPYAMVLADLGFNAFVVTYRTGQGGISATEDMARAVDYILANADILKVSREGYSVWGSSAGARMAAYLGSHGPSAFGANTTKRPSTVVMAYTSHSDIGETEPPTYVIVGERDGIAPPSSMLPRVNALKQLGTDVAFRVVPDIGHGFGAGTGTAAEGWIQEAASFWREHLPKNRLSPFPALPNKGTSN